MAIYSWTGYTEKGKTSSGMIDASSLREAKIKLRSQGLFVSTIAEEAHGIAHPLRDLSIKGLLGRVRMEDLAVTPASFPPSWVRPSRWWTRWVPSSNRPTPRP